MTVKSEHDDEYRAVMQALADREAMPPDAAARVERDLRRAFAGYRAAPTAPAISPADDPGRWRWWIAAAAAAAAVVVVASGAVKWREPRVITEDHVTLAPGGPGATQAASRPAADAPPASVTPPASRGPVAPARQRPRPARGAAAALRPAGFVPLPEAAALPPFESGSIVRLEVPVASLPGYGFDISPASDVEAVEADVLVGQDGQARAIRLVTNSARSNQ